jgi:hypothetical protein
MAFRIRLGLKMSFHESDKEIEEVVDLNDEDLYIDSDETELVDNALPPIPKPEVEKGKAKSQQVSNSALKVRRGIEDYFEKKRLRHELDYLLEDDEK